MGRMKVFARLLDATGSFTKNVQLDDVRKRKLTTEEIIGELGDANELNLIDEKDMHVFGLKPMDDPLCLVSCNFCKKTISASQYTSHAELCKYLGFHKGHEEVVEVDDNSGHKKTTRKRRNKVSRYPPEKKTRIESIKVDDSAGSKSYHDDRIGTVSSLSTLTDDSLDGMPKLDVSSVNFGIQDFSTSTIGHLKHCKLMDATITMKPDERVQPDAKCSRYQDAQTCRRISGVAVGGCGKPYKQLLDHQKSTKFPNDCSSYAVPAPLATKMFYSQQSNHLRSALSLMFHKASEIRSSSDMASSESHGNRVSPKTFSILDELGKEFSDPKEPSHQSMVCGSAFGVQSAGDFSKNKGTSSLAANNFIRSHTAASVELLNRSII